jgi:hypothetical protein
MQRERTFTEARSRTRALQVQPSARWAGAAPPHPRHRPRGAVRLGPPRSGVFGVRARARAKGQVRRRLHACEIGAARRPYAMTPPGGRSGRRHLPASMQ